MQPKVKNIIAFLQSKGWRLAEPSPKYFFLSPPDYVRFQEPFQIRVPRFEGGEDTPEYLLRLSHDIARMYDIDRYDMVLLLSKNELELKREISEQRESLKMKETFYSQMAQTS